MKDLIKSFLGIIKPGENLHVCVGVGDQVSNTEFQIGDKVSNERNICSLCCDCDELIFGFALKYRNLCGQQDS